MLLIVIPASQQEYWDETNEEFVYRTVGKEQTLQLEHSLISLSKWESKWHKSFIHSEKTDEEYLDYIKCMTINSNVDSDVYDRLTPENIKEITDYIHNPMTATTFRKTNENPSREIVTSEIIYYWMVTFNIPFECEKWHINRLLTLIQICQVKSTKPKKRSRSEIMRENAALNAARRKQFNSKG